MIQPGPVSLDNTNEFTSQTFNNKCILVGVDINFCGQQILGLLAHT